LKRLNIVRLGDAISVISAGGGCGATTLALNLANELRLAYSEPTAIVDLDYSYGAVGRFLRLAEEFAIKNTPPGETPAPVRSDATIDLILNPVDGRLADHAMLQGSTVQFDKALYALLSPAAGDEHRGVPHNSLNCAHLDHVLALCKQSFRYTVVDAPRVSGEGLLALGASSAMVLVMLRPMVNDIRVARKILRFLKDEVRVEHLKAVHIGGSLWQWLSTNTSKEVRNLLKDFDVCEIANDFSAASGALNYGKPLSERSPKSHLRRDISRLAAEFAEVAKRAN
jgi:pilus assembly protein CpaE